MATLKWTSEKLTDHFSVAEYMIHQIDKTIPITRDAYEHAMMLEEFRKWLGKPMTVNAWYRSKAYNDALIKSGAKASKNSNHLKGCATDISYPNVPFETVMKWGRKWKEICKKYGCVGEIGSYSWGIHLGSHITYSTQFSNWKTDSKGQHNGFYKL